MTPIELSERSGRILAVLVREYIETGEPIGSHVLVRRGGLGVSSATVRAILAKLEELGYVRQPHTSAGRVPTDGGYRFYVDQLLEGPRPTRTASLVLARLRRETGSPPLIEDLLANVSHVLSRVSGHVGFALPPADEVAVFQEVEFVPIAASKVLVVVVARGGQVSRKVVDIGEALEPADLRQAANYLNTEFSGMTLVEVRAAVVSRLRQERTLYDVLCSRALRLARSSFEDLPRQNRLFVEGTSSLLDASAEAGGLPIATLRALLKMMEEKERLVRILNEYIDGPGLTVVIGAEHTAPDLRSVSVVASTYVDGHTTGTIGVLGPTRMRYSRAIDVVEGAAQAVSRVLRDN